MTAFVPPSEPESVKANILKKYLGILLWDDVVMTTDKDQVLSDSRAINRAHHEFVAKLLGNKAPQWRGEAKAGSGTEDDEMGVHIGDIYQNIQVPGQYPSSVVAGEAGIQMDQATQQPQGTGTPSGTSKLRNIAALACLAGSLVAGPSAYTELVALFNAAAEVKVIWDGKEITPGDSAAAGAEQSTTVGAEQ